MSAIISGPEQVTPEWLTDVLRARGFLPRGEVYAVECGATIEGGYSLLWPLRISYAWPALSTSSASSLSAAADALAPSALLLKVPRADIETALNAINGRREHLFYTVIAPTMPDLPVIQCYDAAYSEQSGTWYLLLEDLTATHHESPGYVPPPEPLCTDAVEILAHLHARWWQDPRLGRTIGELPDEAAIERQVQNVTRAIAAFLDFLDSHISAERRRLYERLRDAFPEVLRRLLARPVTLIHGDAHRRNFLYSNNRDQHTTRIIDWQSCNTGTPTHDLAYMLARHWHPEPRRDLMAGTLARYHETLARNGVADYSADQFPQDFRLAVLRHAEAPATNWYRWGRSGTRQQPPEEWAKRLERFLVLFDTLGCAELLNAL